MSSSAILVLLKQTNRLPEAETINRLLKKQSRPRNKRVNTTDSPLPQSGTRTPKPKLKIGEEGDEAEGDEEEEQMETVDMPEEIKPTMFRWVSSLHEKNGEAEENQVQMVIRFSVPESFFPPPPPPVLPLSEKSNDESRLTQIEENSPLSEIRKARGPGICAVEGCGKPRKYRVPKDWTIGACGCEHLRIIGSQI